MLNKKMLNKEKRKRKEGGITLIALIITIIILIILAVVSINAVMQTRMIDVATKGAGDYARASVEEDIQLLLANYPMEKAKHNFNYSLGDFLNDLRDERRNNNRENTRGRNRGI